jgi:hypothetical protein
VTGLQGTAAEILEAITDAPVIDTHEHTRLSDSRGIGGIGDLMVPSFVRLCFRAADGSPNSLGQALERPIPSTWVEAAPVIERLRANSLWHWFEQGVCELHGLGEVTAIDGESWDMLGDSIRRRHADPSWLPAVLDRARIETVLWDPYWDVGTTDVPEARYRPSPRLDSAISSFHPDASDYEGNNLIRDRAAEHGLEVNTLGDLETLIDRVLDASVSAGARSTKLAMAYERTLRLGPATRAQASTIFGTTPEEITDEGKLVFGDYIVRYYAERAQDLGLVLQVHTGVARLADSNPLQLEPLLQAYPGLVVDVFHGGYPWVRECAALAHAYPNVRLNLVWLPHLSTEAARTALKEWLQVVPQVSRIGWGGDCRVPEETYGALLAVKYCMGVALGELVDDGYLRLQDAIYVARSILYDGPAETYGLGASGAEAGAR